MKTGCVKFSTDDCRLCRKNSRIIWCSFVFAVLWWRLGLRSKTEYEMKDQNFSFNFQIFKYRCLKTNLHLCYIKQNYWNRSLCPLSIRLLPQVLRQGLHWACLQEGRSPGTALVTSLPLLAVTLYCSFFQFVFVRRWNAVLSWVKVQ